MMSECLNCGEWEAESCPNCVEKKIKKAREEERKLVFRILYNKGFDIPLAYLMKEWDMSVKELKGD